MKKTLTAIAILFALTSNANPIDSTKNVNIMNKAISIRLAQRAHFYRTFKQGPGCPMQYSLLHPESASRQRRSLIISAVVFIGIIIAASSIKPQ